MVEIVVIEFQDGTSIRLTPQEATRLEWAMAVWDQESRIYS